jgi:hypothetical protein
VYADTSDFLSSTFSTPYGASVPVSYYVGPVISGKDHWDVIYENLENYPGISYVAEASPYYNCYTYALVFDGITSGMHYMSTEEVFNIDDVDLLINPNPCYTFIGDFSNVQEGDLILYNVKPMNGKGSVSLNDCDVIHIGIIETKASTFEESRIISKWGGGAVYNHDPINTPYKRYTYQVGMNGSKVYLPLTYTNLESPYDYELLFTFGRISHINTTYSQIIKSNGTPNSTHHRATCTECGAYHNEVHDSDEYEAIITKVGSLTVSTDHKILCSECGYYHGQEDHEIEVVNNFGVCIKCGYNTGVMQNNIEPEVEIK